MLTILPSFTESHGWGTVTASSLHLAANGTNPPGTALGLGVSFHADAGEEAFKPEVARGEAEITSGPQTEPRLQVPASVGSSPDRDLK